MSTRQQPPMAYSCREAGAYAAFAARPMCRLLQQQSQGAWSAKVCVAAWRTAASWFGDLSGMLETPMTAGVRPRTAHVERRAAATISERVWSGVRRGARFRPPATSPYTCSPPCPRNWPAGWRHVLRTRRSGWAQPAVSGLGGVGARGGGRSPFLTLRHCATLRLCSARVRAKAWPPLPSATKYR
jgi:hypothetical protein